MYCSYLRTEHAVTGLQCAGLGFRPVAQAQFAVDRGAFCIHASLLMRFSPIPQKHRSEALHVPEHNTKGVFNIIKLSVEHRSHTSAEQKTKKAQSKVESHAEDSLLGSVISLISLAVLCMPTGNLLNLPFLYKRDHKLVCLEEPEI